LTSATSRFRRFAASIKSNPFSDWLEIPTLTDIPVNDLDEVEMSTFKSETTSGRLLIPFIVSSKDDSDCLSEAAVVLGLRSRNASTQHLISTFPTEDRTDRDGEMDAYAYRVQALVDSSLAL